MGQILTPKGEPSSYLRSYPFKKACKTLIKKMESDKFLFLVPEVCLKLSREVPQVLCGGCSVFLSFSGGAVQDYDRGILVGDKSHGRDSGREWFSVF